MCISMATSYSKMIMHFDFVFRKELETNTFLVLCYYTQEYKNCIILRIFVWSWVTLNISMNLRREEIMFIDLDSTKNVSSHEFLKMTSPQPHYGK